MMLGTLDDPSSITVNMRIFTDEEIKWVSFGEDDTIYGKHRLNSAGTPATPLKCLRKLGK